MLQLMVGCGTAIYSWQLAVKVEGPQSGPYSAQGVTHVTLVTDEDK